MTRIILYNLFYLNIELRNKHIQSEICPKIEKTTDNQWLLSGWQEDSMPPQISINQLVKNPFEEPLTFLLTYSLLGD
ncbi:hypothetical protein [Olivibacter ginsenosidimutans]|uniref:hypothetical protein n=1 Tax=Olivibacter ginsenosidimutans TaxID=1176537 RepID=UPI0031E81A3B